MANNRHGPSEQEFASLARRLQKVNCPLPDLVPPCEPISISQVGPVFLSTVFDLIGACTGFMVNVSIVCLANEFRIADFDLLLPWDDPNLYWLELPEGARFFKEYSFPRGGPTWPADQVLNDKKCCLRRGSCLEGLLLAVGFAPIPAKYERGLLPADLRVSNHLGEAVSSTVQLVVDRSAKAYNAKLHERARRRASLFSEIVSEEESRGYAAQIPNRASRRDSQAGKH